MSTDPKCLSLFVIVQSFYVIMRKRVVSLFMLIPLETLVGTIIKVKPASFGSNPQVSSLVFCKATDHRKTKSLVLVQSGTIMGINFIFGIKIVHPTEIGAHPESSLVIFNNAINRSITQTSRYICRSIIDKFVFLLIKLIQTIESCNP